MSYDVKRLSPDLIPDYLKFFDDIAFCDNPAWSKCYCCHFYLSDDNDVNTRDYCQELIKEGKLNGFLAFENDRPVGWCNCDEINNYPRIIQNPYGLDILDNTVALVCFLVDPKRRRQGIASALIVYAIAFYKNTGYEWMDVVTMKQASSDQDNYHGPRSLYDRLDFAVVGENDHFYIMRRRL
ncbi:GNAT family N-acetyltransferase [Acidaminobacter sp. JC074]|uniref:GNAT family N-acetyltransferase n=1 Tax=Acidaminobacter sp. JC074 TaxID=2530199 RepID=UPI001F118850|nr:GNAT family N-acetyltransferase [Acidaminobacter sp. JC074]MCH4889854.1 GNAT family N-acetyltransferase [Acidaminobacter sp. JC074]